jgi:dihydroorotate dehydrogenase (NAD+) catalytic subunit
MADLTVDLGKLTLKNPVMTASGTFGYGFEYKDYFKMNQVAIFRRPFEAFHSWKYD